MANEGSPAAHKLKMRYRQILAFGSHALCSILIALLAISLSSCSDEKDEPRKPSSSNDNNSVVINSDGTATGGAVFSRLDGETFFLDYVKYKVVDAHLEIIDYDSQELPAEPKLYAEVTLDGVKYKTRSIGSRAFGWANIKSIAIPVTVTRLDSECFCGCDLLPSVTLPDGLRWIGDECFRDCRSLTSVTIPDGVTQIRPYCFQGCRSLTTVTLPKSLNLNGSFYPGLGMGCFRECDSLAEITFKSDVPSYSDGYDYWGVSSNPIAYVPMQYLQNYKDSDIAWFFSAIIGY